MTAKNFAREAQTIPDIWNPDHKEFRLYGKESSSLWKLQYKRKYVKLPDIRNLSDMEENEVIPKNSLTSLQPELSVLRKKKDPKLSVLLTLNLSTHRLGAYKTQRTYTCVAKLHIFLPNEVS